MSIIAVPITVAVLSVIIYILNKEDPKCNLTNPDNRKFFNYYGINDIQPFNRSAEDHDNMPIYENFIEGAMNARSIIVLGERGSGKTKLRNYRILKLNNNENIIVKFYGNSINKYLDNFVNNFKAKNPHSTDADHEIIAKHWTQKDYIQMIISELASIIVKSDSIDKNVLHDLPQDDIFEVASLLSYYTIEYPQELLNKINYFLTSNNYCDKFWVKTNCQIDVNNIELQERDFGGVYHDTIHYGQIKELFDKQSIWGKNTAQSAKLLLGISKITGAPVVRELLEKSVSIHLDKLSKFFLKTIEKTPVIIADSLDENKYFFFQENIYLNALQAFVNSTIHTDALLPALGQRDTAAFNTLLFFPLVKGLVVKWERVDKIPIITIEWSFEKLRNYAEYLFQFMRNNQINACKVLPKFDELIKDPKVALEHLRHPRDLHIFLAKLIDRLNEVVKDRDYNFVANDDDIQITLKNAQREMLRKN